jgi:hypothetical protein
MAGSVEIATRSRMHRLRSFTSVSASIHGMA